MFKHTTSLLASVISIAALTLFSLSEAHASHALGAELTYQSLGNNQYLLRLTFYRDCGGTVSIASVGHTIDINSSCYNSSITLQLQDPPVYGPPFDQYLQDYEIPIYCQASNCGNGSLPGIQEIVYEGTVTLQPCSDYVFSYSENARSASIQTIQSPGSEDIYVEAFLNSVDAPNNSSPQFDLPARGIICLNQPNTMIHTATDYDGDMLVYSLYTPLTGSNSTVSYVSGYSSSNPINNSNLTFTNGILNITPTEQAVAVMGVMVEEYRNGVLIGRVMRDFQVTVVTSCPQNPDGLFETNYLPGFDADSIVVCTEDTISFDIYLGNTQQGPNYYLNVGNLSDFQGATFEVEPDTANPGSVIGHFTWAPNLSNINTQALVFQAYDDNCPVVGYSNFTFTFYFNNIIADVTPEYKGIACNDSTLLTVALDGATGPVTYEWQDGTQTASYWAQSGNFSVFAMDSLGCYGNDFYVVYVNNYPIASIDVPDVCQNESMEPVDMSFNFAEQGITPLQLTNWNWDFGDGQGTSTDTLPQYMYAAPGDYTVTLILENENGCLDTAEATVTVHPLPEFDATPSITCIGLQTDFANNSTIQSGNIVSWSWDFGDAGATSDQQSPSYQYPSVGEYEVTLSATTDKGCESDTTFTAAVVETASAAFSYISEPQCDNENFILKFTNESENAVAYLWDFEVATDTSENPVYETPNGFGPNVMMVAYAYPNEGECSDTAWLDVSEMWLGIDFDTINAGNIITPNGDGFNDCLAPFWHEAYAECYRLRIWDRWGMFIYDSNDVENGYCWPGTDQKGHPVSNGTFYFVAEVNSYSRAGYVTVAK
ncbi:MAG: PKD domain-containing protein [Flavobacteriales bacterium]|nr:PKD domain-containing protein [Flavobacteriales bacterium]